MSWHLVVCTITWCSLCTVPQTGREHDRLNWWYWLADSITVCQFSCRHFDPQVPTCQLLTFKMTKAFRPEWISVYNTCAFCYKIWYHRCQSCMHADTKHGLTMSIYAWLTEHIQRWPYIPTLNQFTVRTLLMYMLFPSGAEPWGVNVYTKRSQRKQSPTVSQRGKEYYIYSHDAVWCSA